MLAAFDLDSSVRGDLIHSGYLGSVIVVALYKDGAACVVAIDVADSVSLSNHKPARIRIMTGAVNELHIHDLNIRLYYGKIKSALLGRVLRILPPSCGKIETELVGVCFTVGIQRNDVCANAAVSLIRDRCTEHHILLRNIITA